MGLIRTTYEIITEESAAEGDVAESGWFDEKGTEHNVDEAISLLRGCEPSASFFHVGIWYTEYGDMDQHTGDYENNSYHLVKGTWTEEEERAIYVGVTRKRERMYVDPTDARLQ